MTEIQFTKRTSTVFQRTIECQREDWETDRKKIQEEEDHHAVNDATVIQSHNGWDLSMMMDIDYDEDDEFIWSTVRIMLFIDRSKLSGRSSIYGWKPIATYSPDDFEQLVQTYRCCMDCNEYCWKDLNFCKSCYPLLIEHTEDCCCCLDRSLGVWYKLPCGHILHQRCYNKIEKHVRLDKKCPLCRAICEHGTWEKL